MKTLSWSNPSETHYSGTQQLISEDLGQLIHVSAVYITRYNHFRNNLATVGPFQENISYRPFRQALESAKHILLESETLDIQ